MFRLLLLSLFSLFTINTLFAQNDTLSIIGVGDIMLGTNFPSKKYLPSNDAKSILSPVKDYLLDADITFGNLEGCFSDTAELAKRCKDTTKCYAFRMPVKLAPRLQEAGFDLLSLSNNHSGDFGDEGRKTTITTIAALGIESAGVLEKPLTIIKRNGITYGLAAFSPNRGTCRINDYATAIKIVKQLNDSCDVVIVSFHGGAEGLEHQHVTRETEEFYGENRGNVYEFAHLMIDNGADIIFGHGPHVVRAAELYKDRFIIYSLGNFATYARFSLKGEKGYSPIVKVHTNNNGAFIYAKVISAIQKNEGGPKPDPNELAYKQIKKLTLEDFPETKLDFRGNGLILKKQ